MAGKKAGTKVGVKVALRVEKRAVMMVGVMEKMTGMLKVGKMGWMGMLRADKMDSLRVDLMDSEWAEWRVDLMVA